MPAWELELALELPPLEGGALQVFGAKEGAE